MALIYKGFLWPWRSSVAAPFVGVGCRSPRDPLLPRPRPALGCRLRGMFANALMFGLVVLGLLLIPEHPLAGLALVGAGYLASRFATRRGEDALVSVITFVSVVGACAVWARYLIARL